MPDEIVNHSKQTGFSKSWRETGAMS